MRILYFTRDFTTHDFRFLSALAETEHQVFYLQLEDSGHKLEERPLPSNIDQVDWIAGDRPVSVWDGPRLLVGLRGVIRQIKPDLIQSGPLQRAALLVALTGFKPLVSMSWGYDLIQDADRNFMWRWATRYTLKRSAAMVGDCETIRRLAVSYGMPDERIVTFPWGVDMERYNPGFEGGKIPQTITLLSTRGWEPIYGVDIIAQAFIQASQQRSDLRLVMLGIGTQAAMLQDTLTKAGLINTPNQVDRVQFPGQVSQNDLPGYYRSSNLYVSASHSDGTSISLLEAMACGCPVLVSDIPGNREWVEHGVQGWFFKDGDANDLARAIIDAADKSNTLAGMGVEARRLAERRANWSKNFPSLLKAYDIALKYTNQ